MHLSAVLRKTNLRDWHSLQPLLTLSSRIHPTDTLLSHRLASIHLASNQSGLRTEERDDTGTPNSELFCRLDVPVRLRVQKGDAGELEGDARLHCRDATIGGSCQRAVPPHHCRTDRRRAAAQALIHNTP